MKRMKMPTCTAAMLILAMAVTGALPRCAAAEAPRLNVYNWSDYIAPDTIPKFESETGIKLTYDGNEVLEAKLLAGGSGYDIVVPSASPFMARQIVAGVYSRSTRQRCPTGKTSTRASSNWSPPPIRATRMACPICGASPGSAIINRWSMQRSATPRHWIVGRCCSTQRTQRSSPVAGCLCSTPRKRCFRRPSSISGSTRRAAIRATSAALQKIRPYIRKFHSSEYINDLANGDLCLSLGYSGDVLIARNRAREAKNGEAIAFEIPDEGAQMSVDMLGIPADAPHPQNALRFIDYLLRPQVIADISDAVSYPNPNLPGTLLVKPAIRDDPAVYPPESLRRRFFVDLPAPAEYERARTRAWTRLKSGE
jgi:putrescine transport system substrate-binding protein